MHYCMTAIACLHCKHCACLPCSIVVLTVQALCVLTLQHCACLPCKHCACLPCKHCACLPCKHCASLPCSIVRAYRVLIACTYVVTCNKHWFVARRCAYVIMGLQLDDLPGSAKVVHIQIASTDLVPHSTIYIIIILCYYSTVRGFRTDTIKLSHTTILYISVISMYTV